MKLLRQRLFSEESSNKLTKEEKTELLNKAIAGGSVLGGMGAISSLAYLTNYLPNSGRHVKSVALKAGIPTLIGGATIAALAKHKKNKLQKDNETEDKERNSSKQC